MTTTHHHSATTLDGLLEYWQEQDIRNVLFELPDMHGIPRSKIVPLNKVQGFIEKGLNMYGGTVTLDTRSFVISGTKYNEEVNYADQVLKPDISTAAIVPWMNNTARLICDAYWTDGTPLQASPRYLLKQVVAELDTLGYQAVVGLEYEFYLLDSATMKPIFDGLHIFNTARNVSSPVIERIVELLPQMGIDIITANCEYGPGQFEINYGPHEAIQAGDLGFTFKNGVKMIAQQLKYHATFMTKPFSDQSASGSHTHVSLISKEDGRNAFLDSDDRHGLSQSAYHFMQGMLKHAPAAMALMAPTPNCYHRFVPHHFAPINVSWGLEDRSAMIRAKNSYDSRTHLENRLPTALSNPYLTTAAVIASGILGLKEAQMPPEPVQGLAENQNNFDPLPATLDEALHALERDEPFRALLGDEFVQVFTTMKRSELARFKAYVTDWERDEYLEIF
ncbi:glutamine synthetase [Reticulibacter mediterranei]|uniref:glutamine synthetase n=1 Tax=Reticulibacter mediterranei TaxID=2778369 RepID=A0A8J3J1C9_9CHLR|nr:glutamine synthetase family protein [Reticulibacter mediterranei]GHO99811.1 glutamine synthetase [Reticulibacter mediterranei]